MIHSTQAIHFEGQIVELQKRVTPHAGARPTICLDLDLRHALYFDHPAQIPQLIAQLAELHVMAMAQVEERVDVIRGAA
jgi:hypothetical protein